MTATEKTIQKGNRIYWMDNLKSIIIFLVVLYHVGGVYESAGLWGWFWIVDDPDTITWAGIALQVSDGPGARTVVVVNGSTSTIRIRITS